jgi:hypothetical protein
MIEGGTPSTKHARARQRAAVIEATRRIITPSVKPPAGPPGDS